jgi:hypothetical protein
MLQIPAASIFKNVFWDMIPCGLVGRYLNVAETCCFHIPERGGSRHIDMV